MRFGRVAPDAIVSRHHVRHLARAFASREVDPSAGLREFLNHIEVRIGTPLPNLVANRRYRSVVKHSLQRVLIVGAKPAARPACAWSHQVVRCERMARTSRRRSKTPCAIRIQPPRISLMPLLVPRRKLLLIMPRRLVCRVQQNQRRMISIRLHQPCRLVVQYGEHLSVRVEGVPHPTLRLEVKSQLVARSKRRFRGTPGVEANPVQPPRLAHADDAPPRLNIGRRISGQRKSTAIVRRAKVEQFAVQQNRLAIRLDLAQSKR